MTEPNPEEQAQELLDAALTALDRARRLRAAGYAGVELEATARALSELADGLYAYVAFGGRPNVLTGARPPTWLRRRLMRRAVERLHPSAP